MRTLVKLDDELVKLKDRETANASEIVREVKLLLAGDEGKDMEIMRHLAGNSAMVANEIALGKQIELEKLEETYGSIFTLNQIKELAIKYKLRFLNSGMYMGDMPQQAIAKLKQFSKDTITTIDPYTLKTQFFILGPVEAFKMDEISTADERREERRVQRERLRAARAADPVLFYKIDQNHYRLIHKWGSDFNITRRITGWKWASSNNHFIFNFVLSSVLITTILVWLRVGNHIVAGGNTLYWSIGSALAFALAGFASAATQWNLSQKEGKPYPECFGETNWNSSTLRV